MRISYVTETLPPDLNGVALSAARTIAYLRARGHAVDVVRPAQPGEPRGPGANEWRSRGWPIPFYAEMRFGWEWPARLARRFETHAAQLVHVATEGPLGWAALAAARRLGLPTTADFRTNFHQYSRYYGLGRLERVIGAYLRRFHNAAGLTFAPTRQTRRELVASGFERVDVVGRGVDLQRFAPARRSSALRLEWGAEAGPVLLYVGRLAAEKKVDLALRAFRSVARADPHARMLVVGDGPRRQALEREFPEARFVGAQTGSALAASYASADLFVFPSESETFGNVTLEALASGLPVLAFASGAAAEFVVDRRNGRLVAPGDDAGFVAAACEMAAAPAWRHTAAVQARRSVESQDWESVLERFEMQLLEEAGLVRHARDPADCLA